MHVDPRYPQIATPPTNPATIDTSELITCHACAGTRRYLWTDSTPSGQEVIVRYDRCPSCKGNPR